MLQPNIHIKLAGWLCGLLLLLGSVPPLIDNRQQAASAALPVQQTPQERPIFGVETGTRQIARPITLQRAQQLGATWIRLNTISWRSVQPEPDVPPEQWNWATLSAFEEELAAAAQANLTPMVVIDDYPRWATILPTSCGALLTDRFDDYARFLNELVNRYKQPPHNIRYWELGNEVDIDPGIVPPDNIFGCWGDIDDPYYGGEHYGEMLKVVYPAIKAADPNAQVLIGGLLLDRPDTRIAGRGKPERFLEGILRAGAGNSFDILPFHAYPWFSGPGVDSDLTDFRWAGLGGMTTGKARFLREVMARYGVDKPLFLNETALLGRSQTSVFFEGQADHIVRAALRAMLANIQSYCWYTLNESNWLSAGLLDRTGNIRRPFVAYRELIEQVGTATEITATNVYTSGVEAYRINQGSYLLDVLWSRSPNRVVVDVLRPAFIAAYTRDGAAITPQPTLTGFQLEVGPSPIYIHSRPAPTGGIPQVTEVTPTQLLNDVPVRLAIVGQNFGAGLTVALDRLPLTDVTVRDSTRMEATIPAGFPIGVYSLIVSTSDGWAGMLPQAVRVRTANLPAIRELRPTYGRLARPNTIHVYGDNFAPGVTATLGSQMVPFVQYVNSSHLVIDVPSNQFASGRYDLTVMNPDQSSSTREGAYIFYTGNSTSTVDLRSYPYEFWTEPATLRTGIPIQAGLVVHNPARPQTDIETQVQFYLRNQDNGGDELLLDSSTVTIPNGADFATASITFTVPMTGVYTLRARIDPEDAIAELDKGNNVVSRTLTFLPFATNRVTPTITSVRINRGAAATSNPDVEVTVDATDAWPGVQAVFLVEYEYNLGIVRWLPVQQSSGWQPWRAGQGIPWRLLSTPGMKYVRVWVADKAGNISEAAGAVVNYIPAETHMQQTHTDIYRYALNQRDRLSIRLEVVTGTVDLYVWSNDASSQLRSSQRVSTTVDLSFVAARSGTYQVEADGVTSAQYRLVITARAARDEEEVVPALALTAAPPRTRALVGLTSVPTSRIALPGPPVGAAVGQLYLPVIQR